MLSAHLRLPIKLVIAASNRIRPLLHEVLSQRHQILCQQTRPQFSPLPLGFPALPLGTGPGQVLSDIGLACDATPIPIPHPRMQFEAAKEYYDAHHNVYADKIEVAVSASPPYQALFWSQAFNGSVAGIDIHRTVAANYNDWLRMLPAEVLAIHGPEPHAVVNYWGAVLDAGYLGAVPATVLFPRAVLAKPSSQQSAASIQVQMYYKRRRVVVEQFFGRLKHVFSVFSRPYILDKEHEAQDINLVMMLTNAHIGIRALCEGDGEYYRKWLTFI